MDIDRKVEEGSDTRRDNNRGGQGQECKTEQLLWEFLGKSTRLKDLNEREKEIVQE